MWQAKVPNCSIQEPSHPRDCFCSQQKALHFPGANARGSCEINGAHCSRKPDFSYCTKCQHSLESKPFSPLAFKINMAPSLHLLHWRTGQSGPDGLELGAQQDARVTVEKAVCHNHLGYNDCSTEALSCDNSLQF